MGIVLMRHLCEKHAELMPVGVDWSQIRSPASFNTASGKLVAFLLTHDSWRILGSALELLKMDQLLSEPDLARQLLDIADGIGGGRMPALLFGVLHIAYGNASDRPTTGRSALYSLAADILDPPVNSALYDPRCASGDMVLAASDWATYDTSAKLADVCFGQDGHASHVASAIAYGFTHKASVGNFAHLDAIQSPAFVVNGSLQLFDYVTCDLSDPTTNESVDVDLIQEDSYDRFSLGASPITWAGAYLQHIIASLNASGRAIVVIDQRMLLPTHAEGPIMRALGGGRRHQAPGKLQGGFDAHGSRLADAHDLGQVGQVGAGSHAQGQDHCCHPS